MSKSNILYKRLQELLCGGFVALAKDKSETLYAKIFISGKLAGMEAIGSSRFIPLFKELYMERYKDFLDNQSMQIILEMLAMEGRKVTKKVNLSKRIYRTKSVYLYELEAETNKVVWIEDGKVSIEYLEDIYFKHSPMDANQVEPDLSATVGQLTLLLMKHFKFETESDLQLFKLYLISCFLGLENIQNSILVLTGDKGSGKSTIMRMINKIVSPQVNDLGGQFNNLDDLQIAMANSYMVTLDNVREISKKVSDILCRVVTGGSYQKRKLYTDNDMVTMDLKCLVIISAIGMPLKEPDLTDRAIVLNLARVDNSERKSEAMIWKEFNNDLPQILGAIFNIIAKVLQDKEPIENNDYIRLVDLHQAFIRIGKVCGIKQKRVNEILRSHRNEVNHALVCEDVAVGAFVQYMLCHKRFSGSVTQLLNKLYEVADSKEIPLCSLPSQGNQLSRRLNRVKDNIFDTYGIKFEIHNTGNYREINAEVMRDY